MLKPTMDGVIRVYDGLLNSSGSKKFLSENVKVFALHVMTPIRYVLVTWE